MSAIFTLYFNPGSCSLAAHVALEESGLSYRAHRIDISRGANRDPKFLARNPWGRVPVLESGAMVLSENVAILGYIADLVPRRRLLPEAGSFNRARAMEWLALLSSTIHIAFRPVFRPERFARTDAGREDVATAGLEALDQTLAALDDQLGDRRFVLGDAFSLCDAYLLVFAIWSERPVIANKLAPLPNLAAIARRAAERPAVRTAIEAEGLSLAT